MGLLGYSKKDIDIYLYALYDYDIDKYLYALYDYDIDIYLYELLYDTYIINKLKKGILF